MTIKFRHYKDPEDYSTVSEFLIRHYLPGNRDGNWIKPAWEYMHGHPYLAASSLEKIGIWEDAGEIVAVCHYEWQMGEAFFQFHPDYHYLQGAMLDHAERNFRGRKDGNDPEYLRVYINDFDNELLSLVQSRGYQRKLGADRPMAKYVIPKPFPPINLPDGFQLTSLAEDPDWAKVHRVLWRGFNHEGELPMNETELEERRKMFDTPRARRDLKIAVQALSGEFVSFCGMFYEPSGRFGYVEPVATDPDYRRMGLGKAAVLEGIRRCAGLGAEVAYVGSDQEFYLAIGFEVIYNSECWIKTWDEIS